MNVFCPHKCSKVSLWISFLYPVRKIKLNYSTWKFSNRNLSHTLTFTLHVAGTRPLFIWTNTAIVYKTKHALAEMCSLLLSAVLLAISRRFVISSSVVFYNILANMSVIILNNGLNIITKSFLVLQFTGFKYLIMGILRIYKSIYYF